MQKPAIKSQAIITSMSSKKDGSAGLRIVTPELTSEEFTALRDLQGINLEMFLKATDFQTKDIKEVKSELDSKTPSQRLRASIFVLLSKKLGVKPSNDQWHDFYALEMEKIINYVHQKIEEYD
jgi:hypothetical protein